MLSVDTKYTFTDPDHVQDKLSRIPWLEIPSFVAHKPDMRQIKKKLAKYKKLKNIIVIGNGGSINNFYAFYEALNDPSAKDAKKAYMLNTVEPDVINFLKSVCSKKDTLVMPISKSGTTVSVIESLLAFIDYPVLAVTGNEGTLSEMAHKQRWDTIEHPDIGGRYSGRTACGLVPALFCNLGIEDINKGAIEMYRKCSPKVPVEKNPALQLSIALYQLDKEGYTEIFMPVYATKLLGFLALIVQLIHESTGKDGKGQSIYGALAPESQHHTNQRFFGGRKNVAGIFLKIEKQLDAKSKVKVPHSLADIRLRDGYVRDIDGIPYAKALDFEYEGTRQDAVKKKIPHAVVTLDKLSSKSIGELLAFWQYVAVYSSVLREVDPYDQPQVESSKLISFTLRKQYKR